MSYKPETEKFIKEVNKLNDNLEILKCVYRYYLNLTLDEPKSDEEYDLIYLKKYDGLCYFVSNSLRFFSKDKEIHSICYLQDILFKVYIPKVDIVFPFGAHEFKQRIEQGNQFTDPKRLEFIEKVLRL